LVTDEGGGSPERLHYSGARAGGATGGRLEEWWRVPALRSWSGGELGRRSLRRRRPRGKVGAAAPRGSARCTGVR
jgi:hypothetical protein